MFTSIAIPAISQPRYCGSGLDFRNPNSRVVDWIKEHHLTQVYGISIDSAKADTTLFYEFLVKGDTLIYRSYEPLLQSHSLRKFDHRDSLVYSVDSFGPIMTGKTGILECYYDSLGREALEVLRTQKRDGTFEVVRNKRSAYTRNGNMVQETTDSLIVLTYYGPNERIDSIAYQSMDGPHQVTLERRYYDRLGRLACETSESSNARTFSIDSFYYHSNGIRNRTLSYRLVASNSFTKETEEVFDTCGNSIMSFTRADTVTHSIQYDTKKRPTAESTSVSSRGEVFHETYKWADNDLLISYKMLGKKGEQWFDQQYIYKF